MELKSKTGWGLPVAVAVGTIACYCASRKLAAHPAARRRAILQRLKDGASPRVLLREGYTRAELHDAGVPRAALSILPPRDHHANHHHHHGHLYPSSTASEASHSRGSEAVATSMAACSQQQRQQRSPSVETKGVVRRLLSALWRIKGSVPGATESGDGTRGVAGGEKPPAMADSAVNRSPAGSPPAPHHEGNCNASISNRNGTAGRPTSVRVTPALLRDEVGSSLQISAQTVSPERGRSRTPGGAVQVSLGAFSAAIARGYAEESTTQRYPLDVVRFLHEDGSRLSIMAETCDAVDVTASMTTEEYVARSLTRARAAADALKAYFKVKLSTSARHIATTVMASYVNIHVGPSPVILACFYVVACGVAYTIQLQTHADAYEERLADLLYTAQSARLSEGFAGTSSGGCNDSCVVHHVWVEGVDDFFAIEVPLCLVTTAERSADGCCAALTLMPSHSAGAGASWTATVALTVHAEAPSAPPVDARLLYCDSKVSATLSLQQPGSTVEFPAELKAVSARRATASDDALLPLSAYVSPFITVPLPPLEEFSTRVCQHPHEPSVTLFISPCNSSVEAEEAVELEMHCMNAITSDNLEQLFACVDSALLTPSHPRHSINAAGQRTFVMEGLTVTPTETTMRVCGVEVCTGSWLVMRWLQHDSAAFSRTLDQYRRGLLDEVLVDEDTAFERTAVVS